MAYQVLNLNTVIDYIKKIEKMKEIFSDFSSLKVEEIGDGNINFVYRVRDSKKNKSIILKQAVPYLRVLGESFPLDRQRMDIEIMALECAKRYIPEMVPSIYHSSLEQSLVILQDLSDHKILRGEIIKGIVFSNFSDHISTYLANTLFSSSSFYMGSEDKKENVKKSINSRMCKLTEDFVFTYPFEKSETNNINPELSQDSIDKIQKNGDVKVAIAQMRYKFKNNAEALIHGDLHIGSIMANKNETYVIDPEFAFYGPMGFDIGNIIGNLFMSYFSHDYENNLNGSEANEYRLWLSATVEEVWTNFSKKFRTLWLEHETNSAALEWKYENGLQDFKIYIDTYMNELFSDSIGFAACEMLRRVLGAAKVADFAEIQDLKARAKVEENIIDMAKLMVVKRNKYTNIRELTDLAKEISPCEEG